MRVLTSREFNQDVSRAKRFAATEPVFVTDRGRPTHVLVNIDAWRRLSGEGEDLLRRIAAPDDAPTLDAADLAAVIAAGRGR